MDCSMSGLPIHHQLPEFSQTHVHWVIDAIQPPHPLSSPSPPAFNLSQHQGLFQGVSSSNQVTKVLEDMYHQNFQCVQLTKKEGVIPDSAPRCTLCSDALWCHCGLGFLWRAQGRRSYSVSYLPWVTAPNVLCHPILSSLFKRWKRWVRGNSARRGAGGAKVSPFKSNSVLKQALLLPILPKGISTDVGLPSQWFIYCKVLVIKRQRWL